MTEGMPIIVTITEVIRESPSVTTLRFNYTFESRPGQFVMVWVPGVDEIPMALSFKNGISVQNVGEATKVLTQMKPGDKIGIRGPFGNGFLLKGKVAVIAGGVGAAPLRRIGLEYQNTEFFLGARNSSEILFKKELKNACTVHLATDDGSEGYHGYIAELLERKDLMRFDVICVCGPDLMMKSVMNVLREFGCVGKSQFSLHRYMKCGVGICGSCCFDPEGLCVCKDGPVFPGEKLLESELGQYHRDASGRKQ